MSDNYKLFLEHIESEHALIREIADWDNPHMRYLDRFTVSCDEAERYEREPIRKSVHKTYPNFFTDSEIARAIAHCCQLDGQSRKRDEFYHCVYNYLLNIHSA